MIVKTLKGISYNVGWISITWPNWRRNQLLVFQQNKCVQWLHLHIQSQSLKLHFDMVGFQQLRWWLRSPRPAPRRSAGTVLSGRRSLRRSAADRARVDARSPSTPRACTTHRSCKPGTLTMICSYHKHSYKTSSIRSSNGDRIYSQFTCACQTS